MNRYPTVFVHGFVGWGEQDGLSKVLGYWGQGDGNVLEHLKAEGYECFAPSLGPYTSTWDRSCELWAYLFGGTVDYGKVHSEKYGHDRYGRTYEHGVLEDLGKTEAHKKMNIMGHSFGGPTVKTFVELMCNGYEEEVQGTDPTELSPLFKGGHGNLIHSCSTLSGVNNGTTFDMWYEPGLWVATMYVLSVASPIWNRFGKFRDLHFEHYGINDYPELKNHHKGLIGSFPGMVQFANNKWDTSTHEMMMRYAKGLNDWQHTDPGIYYFAHRADGSKPFLGNLRLPDRKKSSLGTLWSGSVMGLFLHPKFRRKKNGYKADKTWYANDGFVNVVGQSASLNAPQEDGHFGEAFRPGVWYNMPIIEGDHLWWNQIETDKQEVFDYYDKMMETIHDLPDA